MKAYDAEFSELDRMTAQIGGLAEKQLADAFDALQRRDPKRAESVIESDRTLDALERQVQERAVLMIARRQPMANDLRHIMTVLKVAGDLERIGDLAKRSGMSVRQFNRRFREVFGTNPRTFLIKTRVQAACEVLRRSDQPIAEIALDFGFCDQSAFTQHFRRHMGLTPAAYRRRS